MGCGGSKSLEIKEDPILLALQDCLSAFQISAEDIHQFKKSFQKIDATNDGSIEVAELEVSLHTERVPFNIKVLLMYDADRSGQLEFPEFLLMCWTYCTLDTHALGFFIYLCAYLYIHRYLFVYAYT